MKLRIKVGVATLLLAFSHLASSQSYPDKPVKVIVSSGPGGSPDTVARLVLNAMAQDMKQPIIVENRTGANGLIAMDAVSKSAPDGYTLMIAPLGTMAVNQHLYPKGGRNPIADFEPVTRLATGPFFLLVRSNLGIDDLQGLIRHAKENPGKLTAAVMAPGSLPHLATELFKRSAKIDFHSVPYKAPAGALMAVVSGEVDFMIETLSSIRPQLQTGRVKAIAVSTARRTQLAPSVPTFAEGGVGNVDVSGWIGLFAPKGTPRHVVAALNASAAMALRRKDVADHMLSIALPADGMGPLEFANAWKADQETWGRVIKEAGIVLE